METDNALSEARANSFALTLEWITKAILERYTLRFTYDGLLREVHPYRLGELWNGNLCLCAYQIGGYSSSTTVASWRLYSVSKVSTIDTLCEHFEVHHEYTDSDTRFKTVYAQCSMG